MFRTRWRKIFSDIWSRKGRTALVALAIFIGVTGTITLFTMSNVITSQLNEDLKEEELVMLEVFLNINQGDIPDDDAVIADLKATIPNVTEVDAVLSVQTQIKAGDDDDFVKAAIYGFSTPLEEGLPIEPMRLVEGEYPVSGNNQVVVEQRFAERFEVGVGDTIQLRILSPSNNPDLEGEVGTLEDWEISGIVFHPYAAASNSVQFPANQSIYAQEADAKYISGAQAFTTYRARFDSVEDAEEQQEAFATYIQNNTPYNAFFSAVSDPAQNQVIQTAAQLTGTLSILAVIALLVSGFLVFNVINTLVVEQKTQIGIMKTLGASNGDNFFIFTGIAFAYGLLGVIPALIVGIFLGDFASHALAPQINTVLTGFQFSAGAVITGIVLGVFVPVLSAMIPVFFGTRVRILEAITDLGLSNSYGSGPVAKLISVLPLPATIRQGFSNVAIKWIRSLLTVATLAIAVGAFVGIFGLITSIQGGFQTFLDLFNVEVGITTTELRDPAEMERIVADNFQTEDNYIIDNFQSAGQLQVEFVDFEPELSAFGPPVILGYGYDVTAESPAFNFAVDEGVTLDEENSDDSVVLTRSLADALEIGIDDTVNLKFASGPATATVVGIMEYPIDIVFMDWRFLSTNANFVNPTPNQYTVNMSVDGLDQPVPTIGFTQDFVAQFLELSDGEVFSADEDTVVISEGFAESAGVGIGDTVTLALEDGTEREFTVSGILTIPEVLIRQFAAREGFTDLPDELPAELLNLPLAGMDWERLADFEGREIEPRPQFYFLTTTIEDATESDIEELLLDMENTFLEEGISIQTINFIQFQNQFNQVFQVIQAALTGAILLIALVGALGLLTSLSMSVFERQKEIGVMRSIGAGSTTIALQFFTEGLLVGIIAWIVGLLIAIPIQLALLEVTQTREVFGFQYSIFAVVASFVAMVVITAISSFWPSIVAARKTVSDILRYQ